MALQTQSSDVLVNSCTLFMLSAFTHIPMPCIYGTAVMITPGFNFLRTPRLTILLYDSFCLKYLQPSLPKINEVLKQTLIHLSLLKLPFNSIYILALKNSGVILDTSLFSHWGTQFTSADPGALLWITIQIQSFLPISTFPPSQGFNHSQSCTTASQLLVLFSSHLLHTVFSTQLNGPFTTSIMHTLLIKEMLFHGGGGKLHLDYFTCSIRQWLLILLRMKSKFYQTLQSPISFCKVRVSYSVPSSIYLMPMFLEPLSSEEICFCSCLRPLFCFPYLKRSFT